MEEIEKQHKSESHKEFEKLLNLELKTVIKEGEIVSGTVSKITKKLIYVDIPGLKSEGAISSDEFKLAKEEVAVGDKINCLLEKLENKFGDVVVSREKARKAQSWKKMEKSFVSKEPVTGNIVGRVKGGFAVDVSSCLCFLPGSQVSIKPLNSNEISKMMKEPQTFEVVKMDNRRNNIVLSRRSILETARNHDRDKIVSKLKVGDVCDSTVKALVEWGCFVDINGVDALLHITDISFSRINKPSDLLSVGQTLKVKITKISEDKKISVSVKDLSEDPYIKEIEKFEIGKNYPATVTKVVEYGAFASLAPGLEGLIHSSEMSHTKKNMHPGKVLSTSQTIKVQILDKDLEKRRISLSYKNTLPNPWKEFMKKHKKDDVIEGTIKSVTNFAVFFTIKNFELDSMIHYKNLSYSEKESELEKYKKGQNIKAKILEISEEQAKIRCGIRELQADPFEKNFGDRKASDVITVFVHSILKNGIQVYMGNNKDLLLTIKKNQLAKDIENQRETRFTPGQKVDVLIQKLDKKKREVQLSIKALEEKESKEALKKYGSEDSGMKLRDILGPLISKKKKKDN
tara:strand:+ start:6129 stop:7844 length:1716 start_codon:yes stop_codon:yes gene_type:complete